MNRPSQRPRPWNPCSRAIARWLPVFLIATPASVAAQPCADGAAKAFVDVRWLPMDTAAVRGPSTILVRGDTIAEIDARAVPPNACRIEGAGKFLLPGLADMHVHTDSSELGWFLANGVTTVREMNGTPAMLALRDRIARGELVGPRLLVASPLLVGAPLRYRHQVVETPEAARRIAMEAKAAGYDYLKIYDGLTRPVYDAFLDASRTLALPLDGHIPGAVGAERVLDAGQALQHMDKITVALGGMGGDTSSFARARELFAGKQVWMTPTLASLRALDMSRTTEYATAMARPEMALLDAGTRAWWSSLSGDRPARARSPGYRYMTGLLGVLRESGTRFLLGTDAGNPLMLPGFSVHDELEVLVREGGLTPYDALASATTRVGEFINDPKTGRIAGGARADLVLVDANPLESLVTLRRPAGVMVRGRWMPRGDPRLPVP